MATSAVANVDSIEEEFEDAGCHDRPIRHHLGITAFGVTAWTARAAGDRVINEHDEGDPTADEELFLVLRGRRERGTTPAAGSCGLRSRRPTRPASMPLSERLRALVAASAQYPMLFSNLACCESLLGRTSDALEHLRHAVEMSEEFRASAREDSDLDPIRHEPAFRELVDPLTS